MVPLPPSVMAVTAPAAASGGAANASATAGGKAPVGLAGLFDGLLRSAAAPAADQAPAEPMPQVMPGNTRAQPAQAIRIALPPAGVAPDAQAPLGASSAVAHDPDLVQPVAGPTPAGPGATPAATRESSGTAHHPPSGRARPRPGEASAPSVPAPAVADPTQIVAVPPPPLAPSAAATAIPVAAEPFPAGGAAAVSPAACAPARPSSEPAIAATEAGQTERPVAKAPAGGTPPAAPASMAATETPAPASSVLVAAAQPASMPAQAVSVRTDTASAQPVPPATQLQPVLLHVAAPHGPQAITVSLHPAELGQVEVRVERGETGSVQVALTVDRPETLHALVRDQGQLNDALGRAGVPPDARSLTFHLAQPEPPAPAALVSAGFSAGTQPQPQSQPQGGGWPAGAGSDTQAQGGQGQGGQGQGGQGQAGQDGGRYRPNQSLTGEAGEAPGDAQGARWLRLGIDITA